MDLLNSSASELREAVRLQKISAVEVASFFADRIQAKQSLNAFVRINPNLMKDARELDQKVARGDGGGSLFGVPVAVKDNFCTKGLATTAGSKILENFVPPYSATVIEKLRNAGALILGKTNMDEFAMGSSNENSFFGPCLNPWDTHYVPGGSSGGSAAAVAARLAPIALGSDTGGSIRQPAHFCGVFGIKPTYGRVSRYGMIAFASSLDQAGTIALSTRDCALPLEAISGADDYDSTCTTASVPHWSDSINANMKGVRIGRPREYFTTDIEPQVRTFVDKAIENLKDQGAEIVDVSLPLSEYAVATYYLIATSEASSNLARYDGVRYGYRSDFSRDPADNLIDFYSRTRSEGFGAEVQRRILLGTYALSTGFYDDYYKKASQVRRLMHEEFVRTFQSCDVLLSPVATTPAFKLGEKNHDPLKMYLNDKFTTSANLAGLPGMSVPVGFTDQGLPVGVQLMSGHFNEQALFNVSQALENAFFSRDRRPRGL